MKKKDLLLSLSVNLTFALNVFFSQSFIGLGLLFTLFIVGIGMLLNLIYMAVNDTSIKTASETNHEEVTTATVTTICHEVHRVLITYLDNFNRLISCVDPVQTVTFLVILHTIVLVQIVLFDLSLSAVSWSVYILIQLSPRLYPKLEPTMKKFTARLPLFKNLLEKEKVE